MKNKFVFLMVMLIFLIFLGTSQVYADIIFGDIDNSNLDSMYDDSYGGTVDYWDGDDTNPDVVHDSLDSEASWLTALLGGETYLGYNMFSRFLGKDEQDTEAPNWYKDPVWFSDDNPGDGQMDAVAWEYAVLKFGGQTQKHYAVLNDDSDIYFVNFDNLYDLDGNQVSNLNIDSLSHITYFGSSTPVPEPATMLLFGSGLIGLAAVGKRRFRK